MRRGWMAIVLSMAALAAPLSGCKHIYDRTDLDIAVATHHIDLRWGRVDQAATKVKPELRAAFAQQWVERTAAVEVQELEVKSVVVSADGDSADVVVSVTYIDRGTMRVRTDQIAEHWARTDDGWVADKPLQL